MDKDEPPTDYGLSSELDFLFSEVKEKEKARNNGEPSQTSLHFASQAGDQKEKIKEGTQKEDLVPTKNEKAEDKLITWAAKLELESLSLKELVTGNLGHIFKQNYDFLHTTCDQMMERLDKLQKVPEPLKPDTGSSYKGIEMSIKNLAERIEQIEKTVQESSREKRRYRDNIEEVILERVDYSFLNNANFKALTKASDTIANKLKGLESLIATSSSDTVKSCTELDSKISSVVLENGSEVLQKLVDTQALVRLVAQGDSPVIHETASIKQYLKLLLPRIIGIESRCMEISATYNDLLTEFRNKDEKLTPDKDSTRNTEDSSFEIEMPNHTINTRVDPDINENHQKKRRLI